MAAWIPADASCVPFPNADAFTVAHTVLRTGMPPAAIIPGFQDVRRSAPRIGSVVGPAGCGLSPWQAGAAEAAISSIAVAIPAVLVIHSLSGAVRRYDGPSPAAGAAVAAATWTTGAGTGAAITLMPEPARAPAHRSLSLRKGFSKN